MLRLEAAESALTKAKLTNPASLAWRQRPELLPRPGSGSTRGGPVNTGGNLPALRQARAGQEQDLRKQVAQERSEAAAELARARDDVGERVTMAEWLEWFNKNSAQFAEARKTATQERRAFSRRLQADRSLPRQPRAPPAAHADSSATLSPLQRLLRRRSGWHSVLLPGRLLLLFLRRQGATTWILDLTKIGTLRNRVLYIRYVAVMSSALQPLALFLTEAAAGATVHEIAISAACTEEGIEISFVDTEHIVSEMRPPPSHAHQEAAHALRRPRRREWLQQQLQ